MEQQTATLASGCFWCGEALFQQLAGVEKVVSGYAGGHVENPSYEEVCSGKTGHAEAVRITFDPSVISYEDLLEVFWRTHDPTTLNRQGNDIGPQYRSAIFYENEEQKRVAEASKARLEAEKRYPAPIVTEIAPLTNFYPAEGYHKNFYLNNPNQGYCRVVIDPKVSKFKKTFQDKLKGEAHAGA
jgi:peptide-methionine (S)-S-oxide reductase